MPLGSTFRYMAATTTTVRPKKTGQLIPFTSISITRMRFPLRNSFVRSLDVFCATRQMYRLWENPREAMQDRRSGLGVTWDAVSAGEQRRCARSALRRPDSPPRALSVLHARWQATQRCCTRLRGVFGGRTQKGGLCNRTAKKCFARAVMSQDPQVRPDSGVSRSLRQAPPRRPRRHANAKPRRAVTAAQAAARRIRACREKGRRLARRPKVMRI